MRSLPRLPLLAGLLLGLATSGCTPEGELTSAGQALVSALQAAPTATVYEGVRRLESHFDLGGVPQSTVYREVVRSDGRGRFAIDPVELVAGGPADPAFFMALHKARAGFHFRYRDFFVRDVDWFVQNYGIQVLPDPTVVAGRSCIQLVVTRKDGSGRYELAADTETGLALRYEEYDDAGALYASMVYETIDLAPDLTGATFHQPSNAELSLEGVADPVALLGFDPLVPSLLPEARFHFQSADRVVDAKGQRWSKRTYTDGVESVFFLECEPARAPAVSTSLASFGGVSVQPTVAATSMPGGQDSIYSFAAGPLMVLWGDVQGHRVVLVGKASEAELLGMLESALP